MTNNITLHIKHNNAKRMEYFLNRVEEALIETPFEWRSLKKSDSINDACRFVSVNKEAAVTISIFFCDSYQDANEIAKANAFPYLPTEKWSVNGDVLYIVGSMDAEKVNTILGLFAGEE